MNAYKSASCTLYNNEKGFLNTVLTYIINFTAQKNIKNNLAFLKDTQRSGSRYDILFTN